jgi:glyoxylase-like metal-dependent hydrolase (beta-lactamase superfamily II)
MTTLGTVLDVDERTALVLGQELDVEHDRPDVGNALVHRTGDTLVVVDTGVTTPFREALKAATRRVGAWRRLLVLTTHGHPDHVGNNDLADELQRESGAPAEHYVPARDVAQMTDPVSYWEHAFERVAGIVALPAPPALAAHKVVSLFAPMRPFASVTRLFEQRPLERVRIGTVRFSGWTFADGAVRVLRSHGHCAGHVIVHLRDSGVVHLADEANGPCGAMPDADQFRIQATLEAVAALFEQGEATVLTDGHTPAVRRAADAQRYLDGLLDQAGALQAAALALTDGTERVAPGEFVVRFADAMVRANGGGPNPNPLFTGLVAVNQLGELGLRPDGRHADSTWSRPALEDPAPVAGVPHGLAVLPAAAAMLRWKLRHDDRAPGDR